MQVADSDEHRLLMKLCGTPCWRTNPLRAELYAESHRLPARSRATTSSCWPTTAYDVPYRSKDGEDQEDARQRGVPLYPLRRLPSEAHQARIELLRVRKQPSTRWSRTGSSPRRRLGFLFPAFDDRSTNIYSALYYSRDIGDIHQELVDTLFRVDPLMPAAEQKENFRSILGETLEDDCRLEVVQAVRDQMCGLIEEHKASKTPEPLTLSKGAMKSVLRGCGVAARHVDAFDRRYDETFGADAALAPRNVVDA